jgi:hypothetical protein
MADHDRGVQIQHQTGHGKARRHRDWYPVAGLGRLRPCQLPRGGAGRPQPIQGISVHTGQNPRHGRIRSHRPEQVGLIPQHRQVRDHLTAVSEHHREVDGDSARGMPALPLPQPC